MNTKSKREYYKRHKGRILKARKERWDSDPKWRGRQLQLKRESLLRVRYGLTPDEYDSLLSAQKGACAICHKAQPNNGKGDKYFDVDHDHKTKRVRGLLCRWCNTGLGILERSEEWISRAKTYLEYHK